MISSKENNDGRGADMSFFIDTEELTANALILLFNRKGIDYISCEDLSNYEKTVIKMLKHKGIKPVLIQNNNCIFQNTSNYFKILFKGQKQYIQLKENVKIEDVTKRFRAHLSLDVLYAFT